MNAEFEYFLIKEYYKAIDISGFEFDRNSLRRSILIYGNLSVELLSNC